MKHSVRNRIKVTKTGKLLRRKMGISHFRAKKSRRQKLRKKRKQTLHEGDWRKIKRNM